ncbi:enolase [Strigomonas culicis]|uniref:Enolase n=1 Tax=Strigomonas culicis TaxID=28005 RepID=S9U3I6_9TRYP|nr:enolase [Strigomonas culicis]|eukprot:EPY23493.1 enolase [Strigomonas culicis]
MENVTWKLYDKEYKLSEILTEAARACVESRSTQPKSFLTNYFQGITTLGKPKVLVCSRCFTSEGLLGFEIRARLHTNTESCTHAWPLVFPSTPAAPEHEELGPGTAPPEDAGAPEEAASGALAKQQLNTMDVYVQEHLLPQLLSIGVVEQARWDSTLRGGPVLPCVTFALSFVAAQAAASNASRPLYEHLRGLYLEARLKAISEGVVELETGGKSLNALPADVGVASPLRGARRVTLSEDRYTLPRLLLPFFGQSDDAAKTGVALHTLYLIPACLRAEGRGVVGEAVWEKLYAAYQVCCQRCHHRTRADGAYVLEGLENLTDAVELAREMLAAAGLTVGVDVSLGLRVGAAGRYVQAEAPAAHTGKGKKAAVTVVVEPASPVWLYTLFYGEPDVTSAQLATYLQQQVLACEGAVVYLEDTHELGDAEGHHRLLNALKDRCVLSCRGPLAAPEQVESGLTESAAAGLHTNWALPASQLHTISWLFAMYYRWTTAADHSVGLVFSAMEGCSAADTLDLAVAVGAGFVEVGGLTRTSGAAAVARFLRLQADLTALHRLTDLPALTQYAPAQTFEGFTDDVPEIKRKVEKKKKK